MRGNVRTSLFRAAVTQSYLLILPGVAPISGHSYSHTYRERFSYNPLAIARVEVSGVV
jgi:hypothetical protein